MCICANTYADDDINRRISAIYTTLSKNGSFSDKDYDFLKQISNVIIANSPDSIKYQYHYLIGSWLDYSDGDIDDRIYHISQAINLIETRSGVLTYGVFDIEYLWLSNALANCFKEKKDYQKAILQYERTLIRGERILANPSNKNLRGTKSDCLCALGELYLKLGYEREGVKCLEDAFALSSPDYKPGATETYISLFVLANYYLQDKKDYLKSIEEWNRLISFFASKNATDTKDNAHIYYFLGNTYNKAKNYQQAVSAYLRGISLCKKLGSAEEDIENLYGNLLCTYAECGDIDGLKGILDEYKQLLFSQGKQEDFYKLTWVLSTLLSSEKKNGIRTHIMQDFSQLDTIKQVNLLMDMAYEKLSESPELTIIFAQRAIDILNANGYANQAASWVFQLYTTKSLAFQKQRKFESSILEAQKSLEYLDKCSSVSDKNKQEVIFRIANLYYEVANYKKVIETANGLVPLTVNLYGEKSQQYIACETLLGCAYIHIRESKKAIEIFKYLSPLILSIERENSLQYAICLHNLGRAYMLRGNKDKAVEFLEKSRELQIEVNNVIDPKTNQYLNELKIYE